jgi:hypothetical protein
VTRGAPNRFSAATMTTRLRTEATDRLSIGGTGEGADAALVSGTLLASSFLDRRRSGSGLTGYSIGGTRRYHRFGSDPIWGVQPIGRSALVGGPHGSALIEARTGRELRR